MADQDVQPSAHDWSVLQDAARNAAARAYCPYSRFRVGAAVLTKQGTIYTGVNIENASYGLTVCAERVAIFAAIAAGQREFKAIAVFTPTAEATAPCGACRQVLFEFGGDNLQVRSYGLSDNVAQWDVSQLLPFAFGPRDLGAEKIKAPDERPRLCVDIDNVVTQTDERMRDLIARETSGRVSLAYEDIRCFNYYDCRDANGASITKEEWSRVHDLFSQEDVILSLEPMPNAIDCVAALSKTYTIHFATSRKPAARRATVQWLEQRGLAVHDVHFLKHGEKHLSLGYFDASIEDDADQAMAFARAGFGKSFLIAHPWNEHLANESGIYRVPGWSELCGQLIT